MESSNHLSAMPATDINTRASAFGHCEKHGRWVRETYAWLVESGKTMDWCPKCRDEAQAAKDAAENEAKRIAAEARRVVELEKRGVGTRFIGKTFDTYIAEDAEQRRALDACRSLAESVAAGSKRIPSLILCGAPGTGKTHLTCAVIQHCFDAGRSVRKVNVLQIVRDIKATWRKGSDCDEEEIISHYAQRDLLVLDEIGVQFGSDTERMFIFEIINRRYDAILPTVLISNLDIESLRTEIGERVIDRLREDGGKLLTFTGQSFRKH